MLVLAVEDPETLEDELERILAELGVHALVATVATARRRLLCAVLAGAAGTARARRPRARAARRAAGASVRAAVSHERAGRDAAAQLPRGALRARGRRARERRRRRRSPRPDDLGAYRLLLSLQDDDGLRQYCDDVLRPIERARGGNGDELLRSLEAFLEHNGNWEAAARALFCHRHTLRYRMSRVEELTGRRLDRVENRIEFWLALRGRELLSGHGGIR